MSNNVKQASDNAITEKSSGMKQNDYKYNGESNGEDNDKDDCTNKFIETENVNLSTKLYENTLTENQYIECCSHCKCPIESTFEEEINDSNTGADPQLRKETSAHSCERANFLVNRNDYKGKIHSIYKTCK